MRKLVFVSFIATSLLTASLNTIPAYANDNPSLEQTVETKFLDIPNTYWAKNEILQLVEMGIMNGNQDFQFRPAVDITKGEAASALAKSLDLDMPFKSKYKDVSKKNPDASKILAISEMNIIPEKNDTIFGVDEHLTREQFAYGLVQAFHLQPKGKDQPLADAFLISPPYLNAVQIAMQHNILNSNKQKFKPSQPVSRAEFAAAMHKAMVISGEITEVKEYNINPMDKSENYKVNYLQEDLIKLSFDENPIYLRSEHSIEFTNHERIDYGFSRDNIYTYSVGEQAATLKVTVRSFDNGDYFLLSQLDNPNNEKITVDILQKENDVAQFEQFRFDRYPINRKLKGEYGEDITSYPTGLVRFIKKDGSIEERMIGKGFNSEQMHLEYEDGGESYMRNLLSEQEVFSYAHVDSTLISVYTLQSAGDDIVETWYLNADEPLFESDVNRENWMQETAKYFKKRNDWYTADGPYNKMATSTEPQPETGRGYGRILLLMKEDRALTLYKEQQDRFFEDLIYNSFVNLKNFKEDKTYWQTEVTSTYLKDLYGITAPFIDTRFNEQIALFYYNSGKEFDIPDYKEPLRNYANLLVSRKDENQIIKVDDESYYISDYFPVVQDVTTHASMNHVLGGMNILLLAYNEFGDKQYLETARAIQRAIEKQQDQWIRDNGDIWYKISPDLTFVGDDYVHLTLEDLINSYKLWVDIDPSYLPTIEKLIKSKSTFLSNEKLGYTTKIYNGLKDIGMLKYLPEGKERTDAL